MIIIGVVVLAIVVLILIFRFIDKKSRPRIYELSRDQIKKALSLELIRVLEEEHILTGVGQAITTELIHRLLRSDMDRAVAERNAATRASDPKPPPGCGLDLSPSCCSRPSQKSENK